MARDILVSTVGTSLLANLAKVEPDAIVSENTANLLKEHLKNSNLGQLASELAKLPGNSRVCGAEINSIEDAIKHRQVDLTYLYFLVSDTPEGIKVGKILENYFTEKSMNESGFSNLKNIKVITIEKLQDDRPTDFKKHGLRNLVRELGKISQGREDRITIDATGGYKAQIAIAVVFGQALKIPVLYRHERFSEIINFPPMPISFDYSVIGRNASMLHKFETGIALTRDELEELDEEVRVLLEEIEVEGKELFALGAIGEVFLTAFRQSFPRDRILKAVDASSKKEPTFRDDHYPDGFKEFVEKICNQFSWIKTAHSVPYDRQKTIKGNGADIREGKLLWSEI
jgi:putative CRISPR-associated protein (TIGR02619 family)